MKKDKKNLLTIGDLSKISGASIKALRYYEKIGILNPASTNEKTGYRYYKDEQIAHVHAIQLCIELDIPLKEVKNFLDWKGFVDYGSLVLYSKTIAEKKAIKIQNILNFLRHSEEQINLSEKYFLGEKSYYRDIEAKYFYIVSYPKDDEDRIWYELMAKLDLDYNLGNSFLSDFTLEFGTLYIHKSSSSKKFMYVEVPKTLKHDENILVIPKGTYLCILSLESQIDNSKNIFPDIFFKQEEVMVYETEVVSKKIDINNMIKEIRILVK